MIRVIEVSLLSQQRDEQKGDHGDDREKGDDDGDIFYRSF